MADQEKTNILLVDDLQKNLLVYQSVLQDLGQHIIAVNSGAAALKEVLRHDFAVILMDVNMPGMDGFETAGYIRQRKRSALTPIIFLTAFTDEVRTARGYAHGAVDYITTPIVPEVLRAKVKVFVELYRMRLQVAHQAEEQAKRAAAEEAATRSAFLAEASRALSSTLDFAATVRCLARLPVPLLADLALVYLVDPQGKPGPMEWATEQAKSVAGTSTEEYLTQISPRLSEILAKVLETGKSQHQEGLDPLPFAAPEVAGKLQPLHAVLALPVMARGQILGVFVLGLARPGGSFQAADTVLAEDLAGRAGIALDNALLVRDIQENDQRKNEFLAMLAHELRNPLAPISSALEILRLRAPDLPELNWARSLIDRQVQHLVRLVDDLLDVSRITRGKIRLQQEVIDVIAAVNSAVETARPWIESHRHELHVSVPSTPLRVYADPARLAQVLGNLLNNAAKYTPDGGNIWLSVGQERDEVVFKVRDTGGGIPHEMLPKIFDLFIQVDHSLDRSQGGLGIGLTLVQRLVEMHGGAVQAFSEGVGQGSEFVVRLPALEAPAVPVGDVSEPTKTQPVTRRQRFKVLVVDDNIDAADSLALFLSLGGHEVRLAHDGHQALSVADTFPVDIVLLDIGLPGLDGYEVARRLRARPEMKDVLLVAVSGYGQEEDRRRCLQAGFNHHFIKPVDWSHLQKIFEEAATRPIESAH